MSFTRAKAALSGSRFADLRWVAETGSTNSDVIRILLDASAARSGEQVDVVLIADHQTAGRGRLDRTWEAPRGTSLLLSVGTTATIDESHRALLLTAMSLAAREAIESQTAVTTSVKWPNDLVAAVADTDGGGGDDGDGGGTAGRAPQTATRKVAGVLAESVVLPDGRSGYVVGIGINCNWGSISGPLAETAVSLDALSGRAVDREDLAVALLEGFARRLEQIESSQSTGATAAGAGPGSGVAALLEEARAHSATLGTDVVVRTPQGELRGPAVDLDSDGALLIDQGEGVPRRVTVGDVTSLRPS